MKNTITVCEAPGIKGEEKYCATAPEKMIDFTTSRFGNKVKALSTDAYGVFNCHKVNDVKAYKVSLVGYDGTKAKAAAICHTYTSSWNPKHLAFQALTVKPGSAPICHFLPEDHVVWVPY
ncbi:hypothetical protein DCAR_0415181 [Daucus carota subsp. sativus]|uniref:BURP domain-containing protein n=1 Tax=Daucus carota subsp. sativus TaxID=79200 RepID=A0AAF1AWL7_DAUCS|nr:hypothetical protein DCAR_0415181 [Daucus carota subsp. sativus]